MGVSQYFLNVSVYLCARLCSGGFMYQCNWTCTKFGPNWGQDGTKNRPKLVQNRAKLRPSWGMQRRLHFWPHFYPKFTPFIPRKINSRRQLGAWKKPSWGPELIFWAKMASKNGYQNGQHFGIDFVIDFEHILHPTWLQNWSQFKVQVVSKRVPKSIKPI